MLYINYNSKKVIYFKAHQTIKSIKIKNVDFAAF